jgi:uncharacterized protein (TIGR03067 family)
MWTFAPLVAAAGLLFAADDPAKSALEKYQGTWVLLSEEFEGKKVPADEVKDLSYTVQGHEILFKSNGKDRSAIVKLDPSRNPKTYDLVRDDGLVSLKGIYAWDGELIKICSAVDQGDRPTAFETRPGSKNQIRVWKRKR